MSSVKAAVVYPSTSSFSGTGQLNLGPYNIPGAIGLFRVQHRGKLNQQGVTFGATSVEANFPLWSVYWVPAGSGALSPVTSFDGPQWLIRRQLAGGETRFAWAPSSDTAAALVTYPLNDDWAGQLQVNQSIDLWFSLIAPTGASLSNFNVFSTLRFWWSS